MPFAASLWAVISFTGVAPDASFQVSSYRATGGATVRAVLGIGARACPWGRAIVRLTGGETVAMVALEHLESLCCELYRGV